MIRYFLTLCAFALSAFAAPNVTVSIAPQKYFVEQIGGEDVSITVLVPTGASPATYAPKPSQLQALKEASLYFTIDVAFEQNWLHRFHSINPKMRIVDTTKGITKIASPRDINQKPHVCDDHNHKHAHAHTGLDPHVWLSPRLVITQARNIADALIMIDKPNQARYEANFEAFTKRLQALDSTITKQLDPVKQKNFIVFHPSFGYFAKDFGLKQVSIEREGKEPSLRHIKRVVDYAKAHNIKTIFVAPQFSQKAAKQIAKLIGANVTTIDPLSQDWEANLRKIATSIEKAS